MIDVFGQVAYRMWATSRMGVFKTLLKNGAQFKTNCAPFILLLPDTFLDNEICQLNFISKRL